jgi:hypothetical protein
MNAIALGCPANYSLVQINTWVSQKEGIFGPLVDMGNDTHQSTFAFDQDTNPPAKNAQIVTGSTAPAGTTRITLSVQLFVGGALMTCSSGR